MELGDIALIAFIVFCIIVAFPEHWEAGKRKFEDERLWDKIQRGEIDLDEYIEDDEEERKPKNPNEVEELDL